MHQEEKPCCMHESFPNIPSDELLKGREPNEGLNEGAALAEALEGTPLSMRGRIIERLRNINISHTARRVALASTVVAALAVSAGESAQADTTHTVERDTGAVASVESAAESGPSPEGMEGTLISATQEQYNNGLELLKEEGTLEENGASNRAKYMGISVDFVYVPEVETLVIKDINIPFMMRAVASKDQVIEKIKEFFS